MHAGEVCCSQLIRRKAYRVKALSAADFLTSSHTAVDDWMSSQLLGGTLLTPHLCPPDQHQQASRRIKCLAQGHSNQSTQAWVRTSNPTVRGQSPTTWTPSFLKLDSLSLIFFGYMIFIPWKMFFLSTFQQFSDLSVCSRRLLLYIRTAAFPAPFP